MELFAAWDGKGRDISMRRTSQTTDLSIGYGTECRMAERDDCQDSREGLGSSGSTIEIGADKQSLSKPLLDLDTSYRTDLHLLRTR